MGGSGSIHDTELAFLVPKEGAVRIEGPACMIDEAAADKLSQLKHTRETAQLDVVSLIDPLEAEHGTAVAFRMLKALVACYQPASNTY